jgi:hypothetical protein
MSIPCKLDFYGFLPLDISWEQKTISDTSVLNEDLT